MGLSSFESRIERLVEGAFARTSKRGLQPAEIGRRLIREIEIERRFGIRGVVAPNVFTVILSSRDYEDFEGISSTVCSELEKLATDHCLQSHYRLPGQVVVNLVEESSYRPSTFSIATEFNEEENFMVGGSLILPNGQKVSVDKQAVTIGRMPGSSVVIDDPKVSRQHAQVYTDQDLVILTDLGSTNGTYVNGVRVSRTELKNQDEIVIGAAHIVFVEN
ncbi:MAG: DUF3662 domain-containing protein [Acidimicrobiaceae bacterium]|nr:DUF3662 domain-containing protein [Acidimicrobiaceae bacterium]